MYVYEYDQRHEYRVLNNRILDMLLSREAKRKLLRLKIHRRRCAPSPVRPYAIHTPSLAHSFLSLSLLASFLLSFPPGKTCSRGRIREQVNIAITIIANISSSRSELVVVTCVSWIICWRSLRCRNPFAGIQKFQHVG